MQLLTRSTLRVHCNLNIGQIKRSPKLSILADETEVTTSSWTCGLIQHRVSGLRTQHRIEKEIQLRFC